MDPDTTLTETERPGMLVPVIHLFFACVVMHCCLGAAAPAGAESDFLPGLEEIEFRESFEAGTSGNAIIFDVANTTAFPVEGLNIRPELPAQYLVLDSISPNDIDLEPGETVEITAEFSVREDAPDGAEEAIGFHFDTTSDSDVPMPRYRMIAMIAAEEVAECNSAVEAGGDEGGGVTVDLGDFTGLAGFTWEMYTVKDQMNVTVGSETKTTGCVSGSGTFEFDIPPGARTATVEVVPNCEGTTGTQWEFVFECPLASEVTADGTDEALPSDDDTNGVGDRGTASGAMGTIGSVSRAPSANSNGPSVVSWAA